mgnify:CR=1 FL=1
MSFVLFIIHFLSNQINQFDIIAFVVEKELGLNSLYDNGDYRRTNEEHKIKQDQEPHHRLSNFEFFQ